MPRRRHALELSPACSLKGHHRQEEETTVLRQAKSVIGIDLGTSAVKAVELSLEGGRPVLTGFGRVEVQPEGGQEGALQELLASGAFKSQRVSLGVSGQSTVVRYLEMVRMSEPELRQAIPFELPNQLPFEVDDVVYDCQALDLGSAGSENPETEGAHQDTMTVLLAACRRDLIEERLNWIQNKGLTPVGINLELFALANAWELAGPAPITPQGESEEGDEKSYNNEAEEGVGSSTGERTVALVDVGSGRASINVLVDGETCFSREIPIGGMDMTLAVARRLGVESEEAELLKRGEEGGLNQDVEAALLPVIEDLAAELSLSIDYVEHHRGVHVEELLLSGGGLLVPGAVQHMERAVSRPVRVWSPLEGLRVNAEQVNMEELELWASSLVVALGLAGKVAA